MRKKLAAAVLGAGLTVGGAAAAMPAVATVAPAAVVASGHAHPDTWLHG